MGDKSPKSKNRAKSQKDAAKQTEESKARKKQERAQPPTAGGTKKK
ncbi:MAG: hypothetical protein AB7P00_41180 [Sandaracinaceae bacterium]